jgi:hypothetical protein
MNSTTKLARLGWHLLKIAATKPGRLSHVLGTALAASEEVVHPGADLLAIPQVKPEDLLPEGTDRWRVSLELLAKTNASVSTLEFLCLVMLLRRANARSVFEFGTYKGVSITQLALNVPADARICTLDLPEGQTGSALPISIQKDVSIAFESGKGALVPTDLRHRIQFLRQDSALFDPAPYEGQMDFVFVDGAHNTEYVRNDSEKGWRMLRPGGIIAWHDFAIGDLDVVRYLLTAPFRASRVVGTSLAFATKPAR